MIKKLLKKLNFTEHGLLVTCGIIFVIVIGLCWAYTAHASPHTKTHKTNPYISKRELKQAKKDSLMALYNACYTAESFRFGDVACRALKKKHLPVEDI